MQILQTKPRIIATLGLTLLTLGCQTDTSSSKQDMTKINQEAEKNIIVACRSKTPEKFNFIAGYNKKTGNVLIAEEGTMVTKLIDYVHEEDGTVEHELQGDAITTTATHIMADTVPEEKYWVVKEEFNTKNLTYTARDAHGKTKSEALSRVNSDEKPREGICITLDFPFSTQDPESREFGAFIEERQRWGTSVQGKILSLGSCIEEITPDYARRSFTCGEGFAQKTSPMGTEVCIIESAEASIAAPKEYRNPSSQYRAEPKLIHRLYLGECRWKD